MENLMGSKNGRPKQSFDPAIEAARTAEFALDQAYKERRARPRSTSAAHAVEIWDYIREAIAEKRSRDTIAREQLKLELPESLRSAGEER